MSKFLHRLLGVNNPLFTDGLERLEKMTGNKGIDTRLIADITAKLHQIMKQLNLDTTDTNGRELYSALMAAAEIGSADELLMDADYVLVSIDNAIVSLNLIDIIENSHHHMHFDNQVVCHGQRALIGELAKRYLEAASGNEQSLKEAMQVMGMLPESET